MLLQSMHLYMSLLIVKISITINALIIVTIFHNFCIFLGHPHILLNFLFTFHSFAHFNYEIINHSGRLIQK